MTTKPKLTYPEPQYRDRLMAKARFIVRSANNPQDVSDALEVIKEEHGEVEYTDLRKCCKVWWTSGNA